MSQETMTMATIKTLAGQMSKAFEVRERNDGSKFRTLKDGSPEWMTDVCQKAHNDAEMSPDDWRYRFIEKAVDAIAEFSCEPGEEDEAVDSIEPSFLTHELTGWLHSRVDRIGWMDQASEEFGPFKSISDHLTRAQYMEMEETFHQVLQALRDLASDDEDETDDEGDED